MNTNENFLSIFSKESTNDKCHQITNWMGDRFRFGFLSSSKQMNTGCVSQVTDWLVPDYSGITGMKTSTHQFINPQNIYCIGNQFILFGKKLAGRKKKATTENLLTALDSNGTTKVILSKSSADGQVGEKTWTRNYQIVLY